MPQPDWSRLSRSGEYPVVYCPEHPRGKANGYVLAHRIVTELNLGRFLEPWEIVHHKNEDKTDYRLENLQILSVSEHARHHQTKRAKPRLKLTCPYCGKTFYRRIGKTNQVPSRAGFKRTYCSRRCSGLSTGPLAHGGGSSNGRTPDSDSGYLGSNPSPPAIDANKMPN